MTEEYNKLVQLHNKSKQILMAIIGERQNLGLSESEIESIQNLYNSIKRASDLISSEDDFTLEHNIILLDNYELQIELFFSRSECIFENFPRAVLEPLIKKYADNFMVLDY